MSEIHKRTFSLPTEQSAFIDAKVSSGDYASGSEVVREGLRALKQRDAAIERWLRQEVVDTYDRMKADPARGIPAEQGFARLRQGRKRAAKRA
jgi:antitoxin ParD1/3/4